MDHLDFSEEEIQQQLVALGYNNIPKQRLHEFKRDLDQLIRHEKSKSHSSSEWSSPPDSRTGKSPPALVKEKVHLNNIGPSRNYALFNTSSVGRHDVFTSTFNEDDIRNSDINHYYDSYSRHSIAHRPARPSTAPNRLETEERPPEMFYSVSDAIQTTSPERENWAQNRPVFKRKVLRKYQGQSQICDESTHSEDSDQESEEEERKCVTQEMKNIVRELEKDSKTEKEHFVMANVNTENMKETLEGNVLETNDYMQAETNPKDDEYKSGEERELYIDEDEKDKSTEKTRRETEEESEEEKEHEEESGEGDTETESEEESQEAQERKNEEEASEENASEYEEEDTQTESEEENKESKESDETIENKNEYGEEESEKELVRKESEKYEKLEEKMENKSKYKKEESEDNDMGTLNKVEEIDLSKKNRKMVQGSEMGEDESEEKSEGFGERGENTETGNKKTQNEDESTENSEINKEYESKTNSDEEISKQEVLTPEEEDRECFIKERTEENCDTDKEEEEDNNYRRDKNNEQDTRMCSVNDNEMNSGPEMRSEEYCSSEEDLIERWPVRHETGVMLMNDDVIDRQIAEQVAKRKNISKDESKDDEEKKYFYGEVYACEINTVSPSIVKEREGYLQNQKSWTSDDQEHDEDEQEKETRDSCVERDIFKDFHDGLGSPAASILTSGYETYRPDSSKDGNPEEVDYRDDCILAGLDEENDAQDYYQDVHGPMWVKRNPSLETSKYEDPPGFLERHAHIQIQRTDSGRDVNIQSIDHNHKESEISQPNQIPAERDDISSQDKVIGTQNVYFDDIWEVAALQGNVDHPFNIRHKRSKSERRSKEKHYDDGHDRRKEKIVKTYNGCFVTELEERLDRMQIGAPHVPYDSESEEAETYSDKSSSATDEAPSAFQKYIKGMTRSHSESDIRPRPKSFIRPVFDHPHTRNWKKSDPVARYFQYKQEWEMFKPPGDKSRKELHWAIRERLLYQPPPQRPQKTYIPNNYVVPTEKKRSALRWEIRHDLAHGIIPKKSPTPDREDVSLMPFTF